MTARLRRIALTLTTLLTAVAPVPAPACTFCSGGVTSRQALREHFRVAQYVAHGTLQNPRVEPNGLTGTTDFAVAGVLKPHGPFAKQTLFVIPKYLPVIGKTAPDYLFFISERDGKPDPFHGVPATLALSEYVAGLAKLDPLDTTAALAFFFTHLDAPDATVSGDAFLEFAKASDAEITKAKASLNPAKLRKLLLSPETPSDRLGVYAMMLGLSGGAEERVLLTKLLAVRPLAPTVRDNLGGHLAGLTLLDEKLGWRTVEEILTDAKGNYAERLSALGTLRYFQSTRGVEVKPFVLSCFRKLLQQSDLADLAIEDLRRWGYWDFTAEILALDGKPTHGGRLVRRAMVQYALGAPGAEAAKFLVATRAKDPKLVATVEELIKLQEPLKP